MMKTYLTVNLDTKTFHRSQFTSGFDNAEHSSPLHPNGLLLLSSVQVSSSYEATHPPLHSRPALFPFSQSSQGLFCITGFQYLGSFLEERMENYFCSAISLCGALQRNTSN